MQHPDNKKKIVQKAGERKIREASEKIQKIKKTKGGELPGLQLRLTKSKGKPNAVVVTALEVKEEIEVEELSRRLESLQPLKSKTGATSTLEVEERRRRFPQSRTTKTKLPLPSKSKSEAEAVAALEVEEELKS